MCRFIRKERVPIKSVSIGCYKKIVPVPTQQYYNGAYMEETVHDIAKNIRKRKKPMTTTDKEDFEGSSNLKTFRHHAMYTFF